MKKKSKPRKHWSTKLPDDACGEAVAWARKQPSAAAAWRKCERGDWMLWILGRLSGEPGSAARKPLVLAACDCAELATPYWRQGDDRPANALRVARAWARGEGPTLGDVRSAAAANASWAAAASQAANASWAAAASQAANASWAAAAAAAADASYAADASWAAAAAAADASYAADASWAAAADARTKTLAKCADIVRRHYPTPPALGVRP